MKQFLGLFVVILAGCASIPPAPPTAGRAAALDGSVWELPGVDAGRPVTLEFRGRDGGGLAVAGYDGCNRFNGAVELGEGEEIRFPNLATTRMTCLGNTAIIERRVLVALEATRAMRVEAPTLVLLGAHGQTLLTYRRQ